MFHSGRVVFFGGMLALAAATGGCQRGPTWDLSVVEGTVTKYGRPLANIEVVFLVDAGTQGPRARGITDEAGHYRLRTDNVDDGTVVGNITGLKQDHGVAIAKEFGRGFITDGAQGKVIIFDLNSLKVIGEASADKDADSVVYDPASKRVFAMNGDAHSATVIDAQSGGAVKTIALGGGPEFAVADGNGTVYVNIEDKNEVLAIDSRELTIKSRWPVAPAGTPTALAIDIQHRRLFTAGRNPQKLVVLNADNGKVIQSFSISGGVDAAAFEPETSLLFASTREGMIHVFHEDSPDKYSEVETVKTEFGAKTMGLDTKTHNLFVDTADFTEPAAPTAERPHPQRTAVPGTFRVLVYGR